MTREVPVIMPKMSMTMETGELLSWAKSEGDVVKAGDVVAEVQTDKVNMEVESSVDGVLTRIIAQPGSVLEVGAPLAFLTTESDDLMEGLFDPPSDVASEPATPNSDVPPKDAVKLAATPVSRRGPHPAVPFARRRASQLRVSLEAVVPTGPNGVITVKDVEEAAQKPTKAVPEPAAASAPAAPPVSAPTPGAVQLPPDQLAPAVTAAAPASAPAAPPVSAPTPGAVQLPPDQLVPAVTTTAPMSSVSTGPGFADELAPRRRAIRAAVARTMSGSAAVPQFTVFAELNLDAVNLARNRIGWTTLLMRGWARVLRNYPEINAGWDDAANAPASGNDTVGIALATDSAVGLLAPVIKDPDLMSVQDLEALVRDTVDRARTGKLSAADIEGATTTLSNLGTFGVPSFTSLLTPGQATALSVGAVTPRPVVTGGGLAIRLGTTVGLTVDHRPVDGADAGRILANLVDLFVRPDALLS